MKKIRAFDAFLKKSNAILEASFMFLVNKRTAERYGSISLLSFPFFGKPRARGSSLPLAGFSSFIAYAMGVMVNVRVTQSLSLLPLLSLL